MKKQILLVLSLVCASSALAQYESYIEQFKGVAMRHMVEYGIPASITLAQGVLESGAGQSELAQQGNNHFGIKCHSDWQGERMYHDDDKSQECFRVYTSADQSYADHALFLKSKARYSFLFELDKLDYKGWAKGLKQAGYATDPNYPNRLIELIDKYQLAQYDTLALTTPGVAPAKQPKQKSVDNNLKYVRASQGDTYYSLGKRYHIPFNLIYRYNDVAPGAREPEEGEVVYLQAKRKRTKGSEYSTHVVANGESMWDIAQHYGVKVHWLYNMNNMPYTAVPEVGQLLKLR